MTVTDDELRLRVNAGPADDQLVSDSLITAGELVDNYITEQGIADLEVPAAVHDRAVLRCAIDLFNQDKAPNGIVNQQYDLGQGDIPSAPIRISRDPMIGARALLDRAWTLPASFA